MMITTNNGAKIHPSATSTIPNCNFVGREEELRLCRAAFGLTDDWQFDPNLQPLHFRLEGPPGVGKNEIVYHIARHLADRMGVPFFSIQGHEEMTPEDLSVLIVPDPDESGLLGLRRRASPLATALHVGGLFFFDEINRVPERALTPLASVLDRRQSLYSATTGDVIEPADQVAKSRFRFCCALNPQVGKAGAGNLADYIDERTLPAINVGYHDLETLTRILSSNVTSDSAVLKSFEDWYQERSVLSLSIRQAIALVTYAIRTRDSAVWSVDVYSRAARHILRSDQHGTVA